ncbi:MAG: NUDIX hydrolase [Bdellovibrionales bacterium]
MNTIDKRLQPIVNYFLFFPKEASELQLLQEQLKTDSDMFNRKNYRGHITTSIALFEKASKEILLIHHIGLNDWIQPGGHFEDDKDLWVAAQRELQEETGIAKVDIVDWGQYTMTIPFDINTHSIPANPNRGEGAHVHHDCLFLASVSKPKEIKQQVEEIKGFAWKPSSADDISPRLRHVISKANRLGILRYGIF